MLQTISVIGEIHLLNVMNVLKLCNQNFFTNFTRQPQIRKNLLIILKTTSYAKCLHFYELNMNTRKSLHVVSLSLLS